MINIYAPGATDWASNGLAILLPTECKISETAGGSYELEMTHPITDDLRWKTITEGCVIKAPVPAAQTPYINLYKEGAPGVPGVPQRIIHKVYTGDNWSAVNIYEKPDASSNVLAKLWAGMEYEYLSAHNNLFHVGTDQYGNVGYIQNIHSQYVRTEEEITPGYSTIAQPRQIRTQLFRVYHVEMDTKNNTVKAWARHISYDFMGNICGNLKLNKVELPAALDQLKVSMITPESRALIAGITTKISGEWQYENGIKVLLDPDEGFVAKARCRLVRDNGDIFLLKNTATDRLVKIEYGKNLNGVKWTKRSDTVVTRIVPVGRNADNTNLLLPEVYVDSEHINAYPVIYTQKLDVPDAKISDTMTAEQAYTAMRNAAAAEFAKGCDLITFDLDVDFIQLGDTEEYKQYHDLQQVFLYDTITINHSPTGFSARAQVKAYEWDAIQNRYTKVTLGDVFEAGGSTIAGYQLPTGGISGTKLVPGGVGSDQLRSLSVLSAHIGLAEVKTANIGLAVIEKSHMKEATINSLVADSIEAVRAHIQQLVADQVTADQLFANIATIALAQLTTANIENANIEWADIESLKAAMINAFQARISYLVANNLVTDELYAALAQIATAEIDTADINWASIKDLVSGQQIFEQGVGGKLYIADLAVTEANMVSLTVGELIVKGADGRLYSVSVDAEGNVQTTQKQVENDDVKNLSINGDTKLIEGSVTAKTLNAQDIFANNAIIKQLMAANIDVDTFFSRDAVINSLTLDRLQPLNDAIEMRFMTEREQTGIYKGATPPADPAIDKLWLDMGVTPSILRRWTGTKWDAVNDLRDDVAAAQQSANAALSTLQDISSDNKLTPVEKQEIKREFDAVTAELQTILIEASQFDVDTTHYSDAYADLHSYVTPLLANLATTSDITGETLRSKFSAYYQTRQGLLGDISIANKQLTENVRDDFLESSVHKSNTPPENPPVNKLWLDISLSPEQLKRWTGTEWAIVGRSMTDNYIKLGNIKMPDESTEFGIAVGKDVDVLDASGDITTINRSMSVQTAKAFKILTGGKESFSVDATGANAKGFRGETIVLTDINKTETWVQTTTPTRGFVLKWGG